MRAWSTCGSPGGAGDEHARARERLHQSLVIHGRRGEPAVHRGHAEHHRGLRQAGGHRLRREAAEMPARASSAQRPQRGRAPARARGTAAARAPPRPRCSTPRPRPARPGSTTAPGATAPRPSGDRWSPTCRRSGPGHRRDLARRHSLGVDLQLHWANVEGRELAGGLGARRDEHERRDPSRSACGRARGRPSAGSAARRPRRRLSTATIATQVSSADAPQTATRDPSCRSAAMADAARSSWP